MDQSAFCRGTTSQATFIWLIFRLPKMLSRAGLCDHEEVRLKNRCLSRPLATRSLLCCLCLCVIREQLPGSAALARLCRAQCIRVKRAGAVRLCPAA
jgi:hypothetical protein